jgi:hypothetical protein
MDIKKDPFVLKVKELITIKNPKLHGSYLKFGKDKACDLDIYELIVTNTKHERINILNLLLNKLIKYKNEYKLISLYFYIDDIRIRNILKNLGYVNGLLEIKECNLKFDIDNTLSESIIKKINNLRNKLIKNFNLDNYLKLFIYLYSIMTPSWTLNEFKKKEKKILNNMINLNNIEFTDLKIDILYDNFRVTNYIMFKKTDFNKKYYYPFTLHSITFNKKIFYYFFIKKIESLLKWLFFNKKIKNITIDINKFRDEIGNEYNELCLLSNKIEFDKNIKLKEEFNKKFDIINNKSLNLYNLIIKEYLTQLRDYARFF